jgi:CRP/FNR family transcriptional regulator
VFSENTFNYSAIALTDCHVFLVEKEAIAKVAKQNGIFGFSIIKRYCEQNTNLLNTVRNLMYKQMNGRMADTLLYIDSLKNEKAEIFQLLSRKDLADFAGISTESTVKLLKTFEKDGLIVLNEKDIKIVNQAALLEISRRG